MFILALLSNTAMAQVACGDTITTNVTLTGNVVCPIGFVGDAITIGADNVILDGNSFAIVSEDADAIVYASNRTGITVQNLSVAGTTGSGYGIELRNVTDATILNVMASGRNRGISLAGANNPNLTITDSDVSDSAVWGMYLTNADAGLVLANNVFDDSKEGLRLSNLVGPWSGLLTNNSFDGVAKAANGDDAIYLDGCSDLTINGMNLSSTFGAGRGIYISSSQNISLAGNNVSGRRIGIATAGTGITGLSLTNNNATGSALFGFQLLEVGLPLTVENNDLDGSDQGIRIDDLVGPWTLPTSNSFVGVAGSSNDDVWELQDVTNIQIGGTMGSSTGLGNAIRLINSTDVTVDGAFFSGFYRGVYATGATTGLTVSNSTFEGMTLRGLQLKDVDDTTVLSNINLTDSANGVLLDDLENQTYDFASFNFTGVGLGATNREYVEVLNSTNVTVQNIAGDDLDIDVRVVRVANSTDTTVENVQTCEARRGVDIINSDGTLIDNSEFGEGREGVVIDANSDNTTVTAAYLGNTVADVTDNGTNTTLNSSAMADTDSDGISDLCDPCPNDAVDDIDGDGLCADIDPDDDNDGVLDGDDSDDTNPFICQDLDGDTCDDCSVTGMGTPGDDGLDTDSDGSCDAGDPDDDNDNVLDGDDSSPLDPFVCSDNDLDECDDCSSGTFDLVNDGADADGDGVCDPKDLVIDGSVNFDTSSVTWTTGGIGSPSVVFDDASGLFVMAFETQVNTNANCPAGVWAIGLATSPDGLTWTDAGGPLIQPTPGSGLYWECVAAHPTLVDRSSGNLTLFFKAEQTDNACSGGAPSWGCDQYTGIGRSALVWNAGAGEYNATVPHPVPVLAVGQNFGYPRAIFSGSEYKVALSRRPDMLVASGSATSLTLDGTAWSPGDAPWTPDEVYNPAPSCANGGNFTAFVGGRALTGTSVDDGNVGRLTSTDFVTWNLGPGPLLSTTVGDVEMRHWDVLPLGTTDHLFYFSDQTGPSGSNRVGLASTSTGWSPASVKSKVCP